MNYIINSCHMNYHLQMSDIHSSQILITWMGFNLN